MLSENNNRFLTYLVRNNDLSSNQIKEIKSVLQSSNDKDLSEVLVKGGFMESEAVAEKEAEFFNYPYVDLSEKEIVREVREIMPFRLAERHKAICFDKKGKVLKVALADPGDYDAREAIDFWASTKGYVLEYYMCSFSAWKKNFARYNAFQSGVKTAISRVEKERKQEAREVSTDNIQEVIKRAPVAQIVSMIVKHAIENRASDIHIEPYENSSRVRFRVDGILNTVLNLPIYIHESVVSRIKVLSNLKIDETRVPQDGRFKFEAGNQEFDLRVSIMPLSGNEKVTMRILDISSKALTLQQLGFNKSIQEKIHQAIKETYGMILVTGPTGSGKSTTLFSVLSLLNKEGVNISTLEDPIEYYVPGINQAQVRPEVDFSFASGLRALMRQDPDIIMVGEIRDTETAEMSVHAALTGHLLFSTLHTNNAAGAVPRLIDMKVEPFLLASTLNLIIAQRLSRRICSKCKESFELPEETAEKVRNHLESLPAGALPKEIDLEKKLIGYRGKGCSACKGTGYSGRIVLAEVLPINNKMRELVANGFPSKKVREVIDKMGLISLLQDGIIKSLQGITSLEEVFRVSKEVKEQE